LEYTAITKDSEKRLNKLKIVTNFFNQNHLITISVKTKVIHDLFSINKALDTNKLELFHLQYTDSLLELLKKIKKQNEQKHLLINQEILINQDIISSFKDEIDKDVFFDRVKTHNLLMKAFMKSMYQDLAFENKVSNLTNLKEKNDLSNEKGEEFYRKLSIENYQLLIGITSNSYYKFLDFEIDKKLLGKLNIHNFMFKFLCGFQCNNQIIEVYEFINSNEYFMYLKEQKRYVSLKINDFTTIDFSKNKSNKKELVKSLNDKNEELNQQSKQVLKSIPNDVELVLENYLKKISSLELIDEIQNIDEQTNVLKTMLNLNIN
jgi:hypothetical protein